MLIVTLLGNETSKKTKLNQITDRNDICMGFIIQYTREWKSTSIFQGVEYINYKFKKYIKIIKACIKM